MAYVGDFHSHHPEWGYSLPDEDGEALAEWASNSDLALTYDAKQHGPFYSARWQKDYSPDLCWITSIGDHPQPTSQTVLGDFPHSQHRPLLNHIVFQLPIIHGSSKKRWNFRKADWDLNSNKLERSVVTISSCCIPIKEAYQRFKGAIFSGATTAIPRGCRPVYTPCLDAEHRTFDEVENEWTRTWIWWWTFSIGGDFNPLQLRWYPVSSTTTMYKPNGSSISSSRASGLNMTQIRRTSALPQTVH